MQYFSTIDYSGQKKKNIKETLIRMVHQSEEKTDRVSTSRDLRVPKSYLSDTHINHKKIKVIIVAPTHTSTSAGIRVLYKLKNELHQLGLNVYLFTYDPIELVALGSLSTKFHKNNFYDDFVAIVPETIRSLPFKPKKTIRYFLNSDFSLPKYSLGRFPVIADHQIKYSSAINEEASRLFINVLPLDSIENFENTKSIDLLLYFGKTGQFNSTSKSRVEFIKAFGDKYLEINREWPNSILIPHLLSNAKNLISFDPISALNHEASLFGCTTHLIFNESNMHLMEYLERYELNNPLIKLYSDLSEVKLQKDLDLDILSRIRDHMQSEAKKIECLDLLKFREFLLKTQN